MKYMKPRVLREIPIKIYTSLNSSLDGMITLFGKYFGDFNEVINGNVGYGILTLPCGQKFKMSMRRKDIYSLCGKETILQETWYEVDYMMGAINASR